MANYVTLWFILFKSLFISFLYYLIVFVVAMKKRVGRHAPRTSYISLYFSRHSVTNHSNTNRNIFRLFRTIYKVSFSDLKMTETFNYIKHSVILWYQLHVFGISIHQNMHMAISTLRILDAMNNKTVC